MPRLLSTEWNRRAHSVANVDYPITLVIINHSALAEPVRLCDDNIDIVSNGDTYTAIAMNILLPDDSDDQVLQTSSITFGNVGKELVDWLESTGGGRGATLNMTTILRSDPDNAEIFFPFDASNITMTQLLVSIDLTSPDTLNQSAIAIRYSPDNTPGLF